jgi:hypothetical protein
MQEKKRTLNDWLNDAMNVATGQSKPTLEVNMSTQAIVKIAAILLVVLIIAGLVNSVSERLIIGKR